MPVFDKYQRETEKVTVCGRYQDLFPALMNCIVNWCFPFPTNITINFIFLSLLLAILNIFSRPLGLALLIKHICIALVVFKLSCVLNIYLQICTVIHCTKNVIYKQQHTHNTGNVVHVI